MDKISKEFEFRKEQFAQRKSIEYSIYNNLNFEEVTKKIEEIDR